MSVDETKFDPVFKEKLDAFRKDLADNDIPTYLVSGWRSAEEQHAEFLKNNSKCDGYVKLSKHQSGKAADVTFMLPSGYPWWPNENTSDGATRWLSFATIAEKHGLTSGARFEPLKQWGCGWDPNHVEIA